MSIRAAVQRAPRESKKVPQPPRVNAGSILDARGSRLLAELRRVQKDPAEEEAIHDARVAARRLLVAGTLWIPQDPAWKSLELRLTKLIRRLGRVRNLDVTIRFLLREKRGEERVREELVGVLRRRRRKERRKLTEWLTGRRIRTLEAEMVWRKKPSSNGQFSKAPDLSALAPFFLRLQRLSTRLERDAEVEVGHEARRELRRLRYAHETLAWAYPPERFRSTAERFAHAQDLTGRWHDLCVLERLTVKALRKGKVSSRLNGFLKRTRSEAKALVPRVVREVKELAELQSTVTGMESPS